MANDRVATLLIYLSDLEGEAGGETCFTERGPHCVRPKKGNAVVFTGQTIDGACSILSRHEARAVRPGGANKLVLQTWYHRQPRTLEAVALPEQRDEVICDRGGNCRHYMHDQRRVQALRLASEGERLGRAGDVEGAKRAYEAAITIHPMFPEVRAWLGELLFNQGRPQEALLHLMAALDVGDVFTKGAYFAGASLVRLQRPEEALQQLKSIDDALGHAPPIVMAANFGHLDVVRVLLDAGADVNVTWNAGFSPLLLASLFGWTDVVCFLITKRANLAQRHAAHGTPLAAASKRGHHEVERMLIIAGAPT